MGAAGFDTLAAARDLEAAGMERAQAEAVAGATRAGQGELATKADLASVRSDLAAVKWIVGIQGAISLAAFAAVPWLAARVL